MEIVTFNDDNLSMLDIDSQVVKKARAVIMNDDIKVYLSVYSGVYMFPGGKIEHNESSFDALRREIKEEMGISLDSTFREPFLLVRQLIKNYPTRDDELINRLTETYYYLFRTNQTINTKEMKLTSKETEGNFRIIQPTIDEVVNLLENSDSSNPRSKYFSREVDVVVKQLRIK
jgi:ADP-ribose pyrophosphatase YjhB (NUDIX family)